MKRSNALAAALILMSGSASAWNDGCEFSAERPLDIDAGGIATLEMLARAGDLEVIGRADQARIEVRGKACASSEALLQEIKLVQRRQGDRQTVEVLMPELGGWGNDQATLDLVLTVPARLHLQLQDSSGDIEVSGLASLDALDSSGDLGVREIGGDVALQDSSGDIEVRGIGGNVLVRVDSSGDISIQDVRGDAMVERDSSGSITLQDIQGDATVEVDSSGEIEFVRIGGNALVGTDSSGSIRAYGVARDFTVRHDGSGDIDHRDVRGKTVIPAR